MNDSDLPSPLRIGRHLAAVISSLRPWLQPPPAGLPADCIRRHLEYSYRLNRSFLLIGGTILVLALVFAIVATIWF